MALPERWDLETDVAVVGSGGAALVAATVAADEGARVVLLEKTESVGGTTAVSGGVLWIPNNHHMKAAGIADSREDALAYLESLSLGMMDMELVETFVDTAPEMLRYIEERTPVRLGVFTGYPDYHPENPGGKPEGGRSLDNDLFPFEELGPWADRVTRQQPGFPATMRESMAAGAIQALPPSVVEERRGRDMRSTGQALVGSLLRGVLDREVPIQLETRCRQLIRDDSGRVVGLRAEKDGKDFFIRAQRGVILASGGFEWNEELVKSFLRGPMTGPTSPPDNTGDGLLMAMEVGAALGNMSEAWWIPSLRIPDEQWRGAPINRLILMERTCPRSIIVNRRGRRFTNEAANYNALGRAFHTFDPTNFAFSNLPAHLVFDGAFRSKYPVGGSMPGSPTPAFMFEAQTLRELAGQIAVDAEGLEATVARFNEHARRGEDPDFGRGESTYDSFNGDKSLPRPFATLGPLDTPPYFAVELQSGALGTKGGPKTDTKAHVLSVAGGPIPGLYAAGNVTAGITGLVYGGAGGTLGPGLTWGYIAGRAAARGD